MLGPPIVSEQLSHERLSKPVAIGVLAPDMISSSAYGTEEMLRIMVPIIGAAAFSMVIPITLAILAVMFFVMCSYLQVIGVYTRVGGSYVVARDNFGPKVAQVAAVALLIDYTVTVAVQTSAGTAALSSAYPSLVPYTVPITVAVVLLMLFANLRGIREAGSLFAIPTYFYVASLALVIIIGIGKALTGGLAAHTLPGATALGYPVGHQTGWLMGLGIFYCLKAFANGGVSLTGLEAVSDGISSFRAPVAHNGRIALVTMCAVLGFLVLGTSILAHLTHAVPYAAGTPTVVSQEVRAVLGTAWVGNVGFYVVQAATVLILFTGGNTSFNGFPYLASFVAGNSFLPRQLTRRGHRLAFSNGIFVLALVAVILIIVFKAQLDALVGLYAVGVFTGFTFAGLGMVKHNWRERGKRWQLGVVVNGFSGVLSLGVVGILLVTKFTEGAWIVAVIGPPMYFGLLRLHRQYMEEELQLETGAAEATEADVLPRHVVVVFVDQLNMAAAQAVQYARILRPDELRVVHFNVDSKTTEALEAAWAGWPWRACRWTSWSVSTAAWSEPLENTSPISRPTAERSAPCSCPSGSHPSACSESSATALPTPSPTRWAPSHMLPRQPSRFTSRRNPVGGSTRQRRARTERGRSHILQSASIASLPNAPPGRCRSAMSRGARGCESPEGSDRCASRPPRARPSSNARSPMTPASCSSSSRVERKFPASSPVHA